MPRLKPDHIDPSEEEEAEIQRQIAEDRDDSAHWEDRTPARPAIEVDPELVEGFQRIRCTSRSVSDST